MIFAPRFVLRIAVYESRLGRFLDAGQNLTV